MTLKATAYCVLPPLKPDAAPTGPENSSTVLSARQRASETERTGPLEMWRQQAPRPCRRSQPAGPRGHLAKAQFLKLVELKEENSRVEEERPPLRSARGPPRKPSDVDRERWAEDARSAWRWAAGLEEESRKTQNEALGALSSGADVPRSGGSKPPAAHKRATPSPEHLWLPAVGGA